MTSVWRDLFQSDLAALSVPPPCNKRGLPPFQPGFNPILHALQVLPCLPVTDGPCGGRFNPILPRSRFRRRPSGDVEQVRCRLRFNPILPRSRFRPSASSTVGVCWPAGGFNPILPRSRFRRTDLTMPLSSALVIPSDLAALPVSPRPCLVGVGPRACFNPILPRSRFRPYVPGAEEIDPPRFNPISPRFRFRRPSHAWQAPRRAVSIRSCRAPGFAAPNSPDWAVCGACCQVSIRSCRAPGFAPTARGRSGGCCQVSIRSCRAPGFAIYLSRSAPSSHARKARFQSDLAALPVSPG